MKQRTLRNCAAFRLALLLTVMSCVLSGAAHPQQATGDEDQITELLHKYETSIDNADITLASEIWSHDPGVTFIYPLGTARGLQQIEDEVYAGRMGKTFSRRDLVMHDPAVHVYGDAAWSEMTWTFHATMKNGSAVTTEGRETQVYHKENGVWRIVHVHYSGPPQTMPGAPSGF